MRVQPPQSRYVVCISNDDYRASLMARRICRTMPDRAGAEHGLVRVVDESGEDYLSSVCLTGV